MKYLSLLLISFVRVVAITMLIINIALDINNGVISIRESINQVIIGVAMIFIVDFLIEALLLNPRKRRR